MIKRLGLDIHGVLDTNPKDFVQIAKMVRMAGGEVHVITGSAYSKDIEQQLLSYNNGNKFWDFFVSIQDELLKTLPFVKIDIYGRPCWENETWDRFKGNYCLKNNIELHFDDTDRYKKYFSTPIVIYQR